MGKTGKIFGIVLAAVLITAASGRLAAPAAAQEAGEASFGMRLGVGVGSHLMPQVDELSASLIPAGIPGISISNTWHSATSLSLAFYFNYAITDWLSIQPEFNFMLLQGTELGLSMAAMGITEAVSIPLRYNSLDIPLLVRFTPLRRPVMAGVVAGPHVSIPMGALSINNTPIIPQIVIPGATAEASNVGMTLGLFGGVEAGPGRVLADIRFVTDFMASTLLLGGETYELLQRRAFVFSLGYEIPITRRPPAAAPAPAVATDGVLQALAQAIARELAVAKAQESAEAEGLEIETVWIEGGSFSMGSPAGEAGRFDNEGLPRTVTLGGFHMMTHPVTRGQWAAVMGGGGASDRLPAQEITWHEALAFANRLSLMQGLAPAYVISGSTNPDDWGPAAVAATVAAGSNGWRLPTEEQWEYAARAGTTSAFSDGTELWSDEAALGSIGWFSFNSGGGARPVATRAANPWGLHDMHGNVWEWVWDSLDAGGEQRVARGGYWGQSARYARSAFRTGGTPHGRYAGTGFRLIRP